MKKVVFLNMGPYYGSALSYDSSQFQVKKISCDFSYYHKKYGATNIIGAALEWVDSTLRTLKKILEGDEEIVVGLPPLEGEEAVVLALSVAILIRSTLKKAPTVVLPQKRQVEKLEMIIYDLGWLRPIELAFLETHGRILADLVEEARNP